MTSATTTPIDTDVSGNCSIIPFLFATSMYPLSMSSGVKNFNTFVSNVDIMSWHILSHCVVGIIATKSSPPMCPTKLPSGISWCTLLTITSAVNFIISSPFKNPYTSLYALKLSKSTYSTENGSLFANLFFSSACICKFPGKPVSGIILLFIASNVYTFFTV